MSIFRSAISDANGGVNVGYLSLFWIMIVVLNVIPLMCTMAVIEAYFGGEHHAFNFKDLGTGIRDVTFGFSTALGALGLFLWGDSRNTPVAMTTTTTTHVVAASELPAEAKPLAPVIAPEDVGKEVVLEPPKQVKRKPPKGD